MIVLYTGISVSELIKLVEIFFSCSRRTEKPLSFYYYYYYYYYFEFKNAHRNTPSLTRPINKYPNIQATGTIVTVPLVCGEQFYFTHLGSNHVN